VAANLDLVRLIFAAWERRDSSRADGEAERLKPLVGGELGRIWAGERDPGRRAGDRGSGPQ
jgi:hypothetical protein